MSLMPMGRRVTSESSNPATQAAPQAYREMRSMTEPTVKELLNDPIARLLMARDGLQPKAVWACVTHARRALKVREWSERKRSANLAA